MNDEIHLWHVHLDRLLHEVESHFAILSADERERAANLRAPGLRERYIVGRAALRHILSGHLNQNPASVQFAYASAGKPELAGASEPLHFNLTHSHGVAIIAVSRDRRVGVDVERIRPEFATLEIAERFFSPREHAVLRAIPPELQAEAFFRCWTHKEAFIKAIGQGLSYPLDEFDVAFAPGEAPALLAIGGDAAAAARWTLLDVPTEPSFVAAVAVEGPVSEIVRHTSPI